ncbi:XRE family transcriptional regulator, partial [Flavonifractor plautii]|nr:XRE family transcriptional regulator [Flavonifractor plautii]
ANTLQSGQADRLLAAARAAGRMWQGAARGGAARGEDGTFCWRGRAGPAGEAPGGGLSVTAEGGGERFTA